MNTPGAVLIIDDEEAIAWALRRAFEKAGRTVGVAATAEDGVKKARELRPAVIFLDVRLPGTDGLSALPRNAYGTLVYLASSNVNLSMAQERFPEVKFLDTRVHVVG